MTLPSKCGRDELFARCFATLHTPLQRDYSDQLLGVLRANSESIADLAAQWVRHYKQESATNSPQWLEYGLRLGVLQTIPLEELKELLPPCLPETSVLNLLFRARRLDYLQSSESQFDETINTILDGEVTFVSREQC